MENNINQDEMKQESNTSSSEEELVQNSSNDVEIENSLEENVTDINSKLE